ncbi:MAG: endonuclease/exonuclease/phosphatase family protein, partial [Chthoniobacterales bacterium]|nr:endonuclease/exonuclease/phosphatase family protein [Chthoniobacterales bacterium]
MRKWAGRFAALVCLLMCAATAIALVETDEWWIRILDFPRLQIAIGLVVALIVLWWSRPARAKSIAVMSVVALAWQVWLILPYTPAWKAQMIAAKACPAGQSVRFLLANVLQDNRNAELLLEVARDTDPDIILLTEIDAWWAGEVESLTASRPSTILEPRSNTYGMGLYSRLPLVGGEVRYLLEDDIPSIRTRVALPSGYQFTLWGVHPAP